MCRLCATTPSSSRAARRSSSAGRRWARRGLERRPAGRGPAGRGWTRAGPGRGANPPPAREAGEEELGGAEMHSRVSGLSDYLAADEADALRLGREIVRDLNWRKQGPPPSEDPADPCYDPGDLVALASADPKVPFDPHEVLA